ncbi:MAG: alpha-amylase family glycosyl hydrolase, partial [Proteobacteria bacterium]|nr:alpha-amylase family glycosyl hydrolase [Pseudomonadota bacterium]
GACTLCAPGYVNVSGQCVRNDTPNSCEVKLTFVYQDAAGQEVFIRGLEGDWTSEKYRMTEVSSGRFEASVMLSNGSQHEYKFWVKAWEDGGYFNDPSAPTAPGEYGNSLLNVNCGSTPGECITTFTFVNRHTGADSGGDRNFSVYLVGDFTNWMDDTTYTSYRMTYQGAGIHRLEVNLPRSNYQYKYYIEGWEDDAWRPSGDNLVANISTCGLSFMRNEDGGYVPPDPEVGPLIYLAAPPEVVGGNVTFSVVYTPGPDESALRQITVTGGNSPRVSGTAVTDTGLTTGKYAYRLTATTESGLAIPELFVPVWVEETPFNWQDAILYFAFTDRFLNGDPGNDNPRTDANVETRWFGGDFKGLQQKVEEGYFTKLGVNTLWISSVSMNTQGISWGTGGDAGHSYSGYHSYWPVSTFMTADNQNLFASYTSQGVQIRAIEPHFGTMAELKSLVEACHRRGIRVLVDFAANHVHLDSPIYITKQHEGWFNNSPVRLCDDNGNWDNEHTTTCWFSQDLPDINFEHPEARKLMVDHAIWLIKETNIDGFRVDAVKHMAMSFSIDLRRAVDKLTRNSGTMFFLIGETFTYSEDLLNQYIGDDLLHSQFDFPFYKHIVDSILRDGDWSNLRNFTYGEKTRYKSNLMGTFMGNHDVARAISVAAGHNEQKWGNNPEITDWQPYLRLKFAWTVLMTSPGLPLIYYGDEFGLEGSNDPDNRRMMKFGDTLNSEQQMTLGFVQLLGQIRTRHSALRRGSRESLGCSGSKLWVYKMSDAAETILVGLSGGGNATCQIGDLGRNGLIDLLNDNADIPGTDSLTFDDLRRIQIYKVK